MIPFGALVECHPVFAEDTQRLQSGPRVLPSLSLGFVMHAGRSGQDIVVADIEKLADTRLIRNRRQKGAKEVTTPMKRDNFIFPVADGTVKTPGGDQRLRTSTSIRDRPERGKEQEVLRRESDGKSLEKISFICRESA